MVHVQLVKKAGKEVVGPEQEEKEMAQEETPLLYSTKEETPRRAFHREYVIIPFNHFFAFFLLGTDVLCTCFIVYISILISRISHPGDVCIIFAWLRRVQQKIKKSLILKFFTQL